MDTHQSRASRQTYGWFQEKVQSRLSPEEIHDPAKAPLPPFYPKTEKARRTIARYYDCITTLDHFVAKILGELEEDGLADDTIVFFYADHGAGIPGGKAAAFRYGVRVPLLVHVPERFRDLVPSERGSVNPQPVCFADLGPTVLNLAGVDLPTYMHGRPFLGENRPQPRQYVFGVRDRHDETLETTRWINDGRYHLIRNYRTNVSADQQTLTSHYNSASELCQEIRALKATGKLNPIQQLLWGDSRPRVMLFDGKTDPWCLKNLAEAPAHREMRERLLTALNKYVLENRDLGFWPEPDLADAETEAPAYTLARAADRYPLERILETANLDDAGELIERLGHRHPHVRYWAMVTLLNSEEQALRALPQMTKLLDDSSASVRIEVAPFVVTHGKAPDADRALDLLARELDSPNEWAACRAARALELLGERARPKMDAMRAALDARRKKLNYGFGFALASALERLEQPRASTDTGKPAFGKPAPDVVRRFGVEVIRFNPGNRKLIIASLPDSGKRYALQVTDQSEIRADREVAFDDVALGRTVWITRGALQEKGSRRGPAGKFDQDALTVDEIEFASGAGQKPTRPALFTAVLRKEQGRVVAELGGRAVPVHRGRMGQHPAGLRGR